jgi:PAS domain S-box-containing protein
MQSLQASSQRAQQRFSLAVWKYAIEFGAVFAAYFVGGKLGLAVPFTSGNVSLVWPPAGVALAALLLIGNRIWPAIALGAFVVNLTTPIPAIAALGIAVGNTAGPFLGASWLRRDPGFRRSLSRLPDVLRMILVSAPLGSAVSATVGVIVLFLSHVNPWSGIFTAWRMWWIGDSMGVLIVTPVAMTLTWSLSKKRLTRTQTIEFAVLLLASVLTSFLLFGARLYLGPGQDVLAFAVMPLVLWGAIRFQTAGVAIVTLLIDCVALFETARGFGPFVRNNTLANATLLQLFLAVISISGLTLAAVIAERAYLVRQQARKEAIEQSEQRYRGILETAQEGIWILDAEFMTVFVNRRMADLLGHTVEEMIGTNLFQYVFDEDRERKARDLERLLAASQAATERLPGRYRKKNGEELWAAVSRTPTFDEEGTFTGVLKMVNDISSQRRAELERQQALNRVLLLSRAVEQTADSVLICDSNGSIEYVNPAFEATTGYSQADALRNTPRILKSGQHDQNFYAEMWRVLLGGETFSGTLVNRKKTGELYSAEQSITPIRDSRGSITHFVSVLKDVTEARKNQEREVQLRLARDVQQRFYAPPLRLPGLDIAAAVHPAEQTGGDYFDVIQFQSGVVYVGIGDVSGHGLDSALVMAMTRAYVRSFVALGLDPDQILVRTNRVLADDLAEDRYVTVLLVRLDTRSGGLKYASAGHYPGFIFNGSGEIETTIDSTGVPLGLFTETEYERRELQLKPQQILLLCTDGAEETTTCDGLEFGCERMLEYVRNHLSDTASDIAEGIYQAARRFAGAENQHDDITSVLIKLMPGASVAADHWVGQSAASPAPSSLFH